MVNSKDFIATFTVKAYDEVSIAKRRIADWRAVLGELHADRGALLGSQAYEEMSGVEQARVLGEIDEAIASTKRHISTIRDEVYAISIPRSHTYRCKRILNRLIQEATFDEYKEGKTE